VRAPSAERSRPYGHLEGLALGRRSQERGHCPYVFCRERCWMDGMTNRREMSRRLRALGAFQAKPATRPACAGWWNWLYGP